MSDSLHFLAVDGGTWFQAAFEWLINIIFSAWDGVVQDLGDLILALWYWFVGAADAVISIVTKVGNLLFDLPTWAWDRVRELLDWSAQNLIDNAGELLLWFDDLVPEDWAAQPGTVEAVMLQVRTFGGILQIPYIAAVVGSTFSLVVAIQVAKIVWRMIPVVGG